MAEWTSQTPLHLREPLHGSHPPHRRRPRRDRRARARPVFPAAPQARPGRRVPHRQRRRARRVDRAGHLIGGTRHRPRTVRGAVDHPAAVVRDRAARGGLLLRCTRARARRRARVGRRLGVARAHGARRGRARVRRQPARAAPLPAADHPPRPGVHRRARTPRGARADAGCPGAPRRRSRARPRRRLDPRRGALPGGLMSTLAPASLASIDLDELLALAALQTRIDRKYVLPRDDAERVLAGLAPETRVLEIDGARGSLYESVYFDTDDLMSYRMAALGRRRRFKLRTRAYLDTGDAFLELKTKGARSVTVKERLAYEIEHRDELTAEGLAYAAPPLDELGLHDLHPLRPTPLTRYLRETLYLPGSGSRATVDTELRWEDAAGD